MKIILMTDMLVTQSETYPPSFPFPDNGALMLFLQFRQEYLDTLYRYAKFQYECGNYSGAAEYLYFFRVLVSPTLYNFGCI